MYTNKQERSKKLAAVTLSHIASQVHISLIPLGDWKWTALP
jgi:hypothetical protein